MNIGPQKCDYSVLGVKCPLFDLKGPFFLSQIFLLLDNESIQNKKVSAPLKKKWAKTIKSNFWGLDRGCFSRIL